MRILSIYKSSVNLATSVKDARDCLEQLDPELPVIFDWETTGLEVSCFPLLLAVHQKGLDPFCIPIDYAFPKSGLPMETVAELCNEYFDGKNMVAHNAKFDTMINNLNGIKDEHCKIYADSLIMIHLTDPSLDKNLEKRVQQDFGYAKKKFEEIIGKKWNKIDWFKDGESLLDNLAKYAGEDAYWETKVYEKYRGLIDDDGWRILQRIELPLIPILRDAKIRGVLIDVPLLMGMDSQIDRKLADTLTEIYDECGCVFNLNSPKQKAEVFFKKMKLPVMGTTKTGNPSTDSATYEEWSSMGIRVGELLMEYSQLNKLSTGYVKAIPQMVDERDVLRGDINACGTETGRCSSSNPNLQNQPNNKDFPVRCAFIPRPGYVFLNYDYSQLELRVMAHMSKDKHFLQVFRDGEDPHGDVAKRLGISRKGAKVVNFGVLYGMGPQKLANTIGVTEKEASKIISVDYMNTYAGFARWKESTENFAQRNGYVKTYFGRKRVLKEANKDPFRRDKGKFYADMRKSVNTIIQGSGADIVKKATIEVVKEYKRLNLDAHFLLQVHDELLVEVREDQMLQARDIMIDKMMHSTLLDVPLEVDGKILRNWGEMKDDDVISVPDRFDYSLFTSLL